MLNRSLLGVVRELHEHDGFNEVYGAVHGLEGVLDSQFIDLRRLSKAWWRRTARTPGAVLGSSRRRLKPEEVGVILELLWEHDIRYWFIIGGNDSAETGHRISMAAQAAKQTLTVIQVPKTIDNDLELTDHSPGYGSAARFVALATMGAGRDAESMGKESPITIIEVMGRDSGWLAAASALGKRGERDAPHYIGVPEVAIDQEGFLSRIEEAYRHFGFAVAVIAENAQGTTGVFGDQREPQYVDDFGHPYFEGPGRYLADLASRHLSRRVRHQKPGTIQRSMTACVSKTDAQEAEMVGQAAVRSALQGASDKMVTLIREEGKKYICSTGLAPLEQIAGKARKMPDQYLDPANNMVTPAFIDYARPLIGTTLPHLGRLPRVLLP